jgi:hypothetical protein
VATAGVGIALMILTLMWRVNPVEGSVMPNFLTGNLFGMALLMVSNFSRAHQRLGRPFARSAYLAVRSMTTKRRQAWR